MTHRLTARVQPQVWVNDYAIDEGSSIIFDAHEKMLALDPRSFSAAAAEIMRGGHDIDAIVLAAGVVDSWLSSGDQATFVATIEPEDFDAWLEMVGLTRLDAMVITEGRLNELRALDNAPAPRM